MDMAHVHGEPRRPWEGPNDGKAGKGGGNCGAVVELKKTTLGRAPEPRVTTTGSSRRTIMGRDRDGDEGASDDGAVVEEDGRGAQSTRRSGSQG